MARGVFKTKREYSIYVAKTKALISCMVTAQQICACFSLIQKAGFLVMRLRFSFLCDEHKNVIPIPSSNITMTTETENLLINETLSGGEHIIH